MIDLSLFIQPFPLPREILHDLHPWQITSNLVEILTKYLPFLGKDHRISNNQAIHQSSRIEAGSVIANHYNERENKRIFIKINDEIFDTGLEKFGALVGDNSKIGANAVLSPGTILTPGSIVKRLELIEQFKDRNKKH